MKAINLRVWLAVTLLVAAAGICFADEEESVQILTSTEPAKSEPPAGPTEAPKSATAATTTEVQHFEKTITPTAPIPPWQTREGLEAATQQVLSIPPEVWEKMVKNQKVTRDTVRERGKPRIIYAGPSLSKDQVNNLIAKWAKRANVASKSFVESRDQKILNQAKEYADHLRNDWQKIPQRLPSIVESRENPWLFILIIALQVFTIYGLYLKYYRKGAK